MSRCSFEASRCRGDGRAVLLAILFLVAAARAPLAAAPAAPEWTVETVDGTIRFRRLVRLDEEARLAAARGDLGLLLGSSRVGSYERSHRPPRRGAAIQFLWPFFARPISPWLRAYQLSHVALAAFVGPWPSVRPVVTGAAYRSLWLLPLLVLATALILREARRGPARSGWRARPARARPSPSPCSGRPSRSRARFKTA